MTLRPKGSDLKSISEFNSDWADRIAWLILLGLLFDIGDVFVADEFFHKILSIFANCLIIAGVWGELRFSKRARDADDGRVAEANKAAEEAKERTAQIEKLTAWRRINQKQHDAMVSVLREIAASLDVFIEYLNGEVESWSYAKDLVKVFIDAGAEAHGGTNMYLAPEMWFGIRITVFPGISAETILKAFSDAGIAVELLSPNPVAPPKKQPPPNLVILVGAKPPALIAP